jgi:vitamin B12 transporter
MAQLKLRSEWVDGQRLPLTPELGLDWALSARFDLQMHLARSFRLPTLNDLYWQPGGNPELLPEQGWSQELGLRHQSQLGSFQLHFRATGFNRLIHQWIFWSIKEGELFWSPQNIGQVWSRGLEQQLRLQGPLGPVQAELQLQYDYIRSTSSQALRFPRLEAGQQLFYTPVHQATAGLQLRYRQWQCSYRHQLTGAVTALNQEAMERFHLGFLHLGWRWKQPRWGGQLFLSGQNIWNAHYRVIERHPMPGRQWQLGLQLEWLSRTNS